jgi:hypothetical protein
MALDDADSSFRKNREDLSSASVSITPIPVEELDGDESPRSSKYDFDLAAESSKASPPKVTPVPSTTKQVPSRGVARYLFGTERYVGEWRRHWIHVGAWAALGIISPFFVGYLIGVLGQRNSVGVWIVLIGWFLLLTLVGWMVAGWWLERFVLTDKRVLLITGIVSRKVAMMPLARVTDMAYQQSPLGMMLNYGTFVLESAGQDQALRDIKPLPHPNELYLLFCQEMYDPGSVEKAAEENAPEADYAAD